MENYIINITIINGTDTNDYKTGYCKPLVDVFKLYAKQMKFNILNTSFYYKQNKIDKYKSPYDLMGYSGIEIYAVNDFFENPLPIKVNIDKQSTLNVLVDKNEFLKSLVDKLYYYLDRKESTIRLNFKGTLLPEQYHSVQTFNDLEIKEGETIDVSTETVYAYFKYSYNDMSLPESRHVSFYIDAKLPLEGAFIDFTEHYNETYEEEKKFTDFRFTCDGKFLQPNETPISMLSQNSLHIGVLSSKVTINFTNLKGSKSKFEIISNEPLEKYFKNYCKVQKMNIKRLQFSYNNKIVIGSDTLDQLRMNNNDSINVSSSVINLYFSENIFNKSTSLEISCYSQLNDVFQSCNDALQLNFSVSDLRFECEGIILNGAGTANEQRVKDKAEIHVSKEIIKVLISNEYSYPRTYEARRDAPLSDVLEKFIGRSPSLSFGIEDTRFTFNQTQINIDETPDFYGIKDGDSIKAIKKTIWIDFYYEDWSKSNKFGKVVKSRHKMVPRHKPFSEIFYEISCEIKVKMSKLKFFYNGKIVDEKLFPADLGMDDSAEIHVFVPKNMSFERYVNESVTFLSFQSSNPMNVLICFDDCCMSTMYVVREDVEFKEVFEVFCEDTSLYKGGLLFRYKSIFLKDNDTPNLMGMTHEATVLVYDCEDLLTDLSISVENPLILSANGFTYSLGRRNSIKPALDDFCEENDLKMKDLYFTYKQKIIYPHETPEDLLMDINSDEICAHINSITLSFEQSGGKTIQIKNYKTARLYHFFDLYCEKLKIETGELTFMLNGTYLSKNDTPLKLNLQNNDKISVFGSNLSIKVLLPFLSSAKAGEVVDEMLSGTCPLEPIIESWFKERNITSNQFLLSFHSFSYKNSKTKNNFVNTHQEKLDNNPKKGKLCKFDSKKIFCLPNQSELFEPCVKISLKFEYMDQKFQYEAPCTELFKCIKQHVCSKMMLCDSEVLFLYGGKGVSDDDSPDSIGCKNDSTVLLLNKQSMFKLCSN